MPAVRCAVLRQGLIAVILTAALQAAQPAQPSPALQRWTALVEQLQGPLSRAQRAAMSRSDRRLSNGDSLRNCLEVDYEAAALTLHDRISRAGTRSAPVADWLQGQLAAFANCGGGELQLPAPAPDWADYLLLADRRFQVASAYFYAMRYDEAAELFRLIATEPFSSPWPLYGRYFAARAEIGGATAPGVAPARAAERFAAAEADLAAVLADPAAAILHGSARELLSAIPARRTRTVN